jgi:hypothetical protein
VEDLGAAPLIRAGPTAHELWRIEILMSREPHYATWEKVQGSKY